MERVGICCVQITGYGGGSGSSPVQDAMAAALSAAGSAGFGRVLWPSALNILYFICLRISSVYDSYTRQRL